ncbi:MAG: YkgJ family cysteine cluster protein [Croceibacterium sp.]
MTGPAASVEERVFGPLVEDRACSECVACCVEIAIDDPQLSKPAGTPCVHCGPRGSAIYDTRPHSCRAWFCAWRRLPDLPDHLRPDRSGLMACLMERPADANPLLRLYIVVQWLDGRPIARSAEADELLARLRRIGLPVWVGSGERISLHFPPDAVALHLINGNEPEAALADEVALWRSRLPGA